MGFNKKEKIEWLRLTYSIMRDNKIYPFYSDWGNYGIIAPSFRES